MTQITIPNVPTEVSYSVISSSTGPFTVPFAFFSEGDVQCRVTDAFGTVTNLVHSTDFIFASKDVPIGQEGAGYTGGTITLNVAIGSDGATTLLVYRETVIDRTSNYPNTGPFSMPLLNDEQNKHIAIMQEIDNEQVSLDSRITTNTNNIATNVINIAGNTAAINTLVLGVGTPAIYLQTAAELLAGVTPTDYTKPPGYIERYGGAGDGVTDNYAAISSAVLACKGTGVEIVFGEGTYNILFFNPDDRFFTVDDDLFVRGAGRKQTFLRYLPDDSTIVIRGWLVAGVHFEFRDMTIIPPVLTAVASTLFDDLIDQTAFYLQCPPALNVLIERVDTTQGFETSVQGVGDGSAGWRIHIRDCEMYAYSVPVAISNSDDAIANDALRELWIHDSNFYGHNDEGPDWTTRGRILYIHPTISIDYENISCFGSGRVQVAQYSSGGIAWNAHPPRYINIRNVRLNAYPGGTAYTEGFQTTNLPGVTSYYTDCVVDVVGQCRVRSNTVFKGCHFKGISKEFTSQDGPLKTYMNVAGVVTDTTITVKDASIFIDTDPISIWMDDNTLHVTTVNGAPAGNVITLTDALPSSVAANRWVVHTIFGGISGDVTEWVRWVDCTFENDPYPGAMIDGKTRITHYVENCTINMTGLQGGNTDFYHANANNEALLFSSNNAYRMIGDSNMYTLESENANAQMHFDGDTWEGDSYSGTMLITAAGRVQFDNCKSYLNDSVSGAAIFMTGAAAAGVVSGHNNKWYGTAKPRMATNPQQIEFGCGVNPVNVTNAATLVLDLNYDMHRVTGAGTVTNMLHENDAVVDATFTGKVTLISLTGMTLTHGGRMFMPGGVNKVLAANESFTLFFDGINNQIHGIG